MSINDSLIIQPSDEIISNTTVQSNVIIFDEEKRLKVIQILRQSPAILDLAKKLYEGKTYQAHFIPEVRKRIRDGMARLDKKENGLFGVLIRDVKTGKVTNQVSLKEVTPDLLSSLNQLAMQQTLADIVSRLEEIDEKITDILQGQINDRIAEVKSGIHIYEQAIVASAPDTRRDLLRSAISKLNSGRDKLIESADFSFIGKLPRNRLGMFFSLNRDITKYVQSKAIPVWKAAHNIVEASRYIVLAYSALNEPDSLRVSLDQVRIETKDFQDKMGKIANWLPPTSNWRDSLTTISRGVLPSISDLDDIPNKVIVIEFQPKEITPAEGV